MWYIYRMKPFVSGTYKKIHSGEDSEYTSFFPAHVNRPFVVQDQSTIMLLEEATRLLGELNAYSRLVPDI
ncbi:MAG: hypothetical protein UW22_C0020G0015, partial [Candidatus Gottesmanbacteria bacterium GW2011_GWB1_44_11c]